MNVSFETVAGLFGLIKGTFIITILVIFLGLICIIGDYYVFDTNSLINLVNKRLGFSERLIRALMDNGCHSLIGALSWFIITYPNTNFLEFILSGFLSSIIDIDHFLSAKSFSLLDAISLPKRPFLHNSLTLLLANCILYIFLKKFSTNNSWSLLVFVSWFSHHVRDANRRGLWFGPVFTTPPLKDSIYLSIILFMPIFFRYFYQNNYDLFNSVYGYIFQKFSYSNDVKNKNETYLV